MAVPVSIGAFVAWALGLAGEAIVKGAVSEAVKDAYHKHSGRVFLAGLLATRQSWRRPRNPKLDRRSLRRRLMDFRQRTRSLYAHWRKPW